MQDSPKALFLVLTVIITGLGLDVSSIGMTLRYHPESQKVLRSDFVHMQVNCAWFLASIKGMLIMNDVHYIWPAHGTKSTSWLLVVECVHMTNSDQGFASRIVMCNL